jgi:hypothetical protein
MIRTGFLQKQVQKSRRERRTTQFLRRFVFSVVDQALHEHYGKDYPEKCLQSSAAIQSVLSKLGIESKLWTGAACLAQAYKTAPEQTGWGGFWDRDHHVWLVTEFMELVDLTISELHLHPASSRRDAEPIPPLWWDEIAEWPRTIRYLPEAPVAPVFQFEEREDTEDMERFKALVLTTMERYMAGRRVEDVAFGPMLEGERSLNSLHSLGHPYVVKTFIVQQLNIPFPPWVQRRMDEIDRRYRRTQL